MTPIERRPELQQFCGGGGGGALLSSIDIVTKSNAYFPPLPPYLINI